MHDMRNLHNFFACNLLKNIEQNLFQAYLFRYSRRRAVLNDYVSKRSHVELWRWLACFTWNWVHCAKFTCLFYHFFMCSFQTIFIFKTSVNIVDLIPWNTLRYVFWNFLPFQPPPTPSPFLSSSSSSNRSFWQGRSTSNGDDILRTWFMESYSSSEPSVRPNVTRNFSFLGIWFWKMKLTDDRSLACWSMIRD